MYSYDESEQSMSSVNEGIGAMPTAGERQTIEKLDFAFNKKPEPKEEIEDERRLIRQFQQEKTIKLAILGKLDTILNEKIKMLKREANKENREDTHNEGAPSVCAVIVRYIKVSRDEDEKQISDDESDEGMRKEIFSHSFRISRKTTFKELREAAVQFWDIEGSDDDKASFSE